MSHSFRNKELTMVILCQFYSDVLTVGRAALADVYDDIEDGTLDTADEFGLGEGRALEVQATHHTVGTHAFVILDEADGSHFLVELTLREGFSGIFEDLRLNDQDSVYLCFYYIHLFILFNCQLSTVNCLRSTVYGQLSTDNGIIVSLFIVIQIQRQGNHDMP